MEHMIDNYFQAKLNSLVSRSELEPINSILINSKNRICKSLFNHYFTLKALSSITPVVQIPPKIDEKIRENRLKNALQLKSELESQLNTISKSISSLQKPKTHTPITKKHSLSASQLKENKKFFNLHKNTEESLKKQRERLKKKVKILEESDLVKAQKVKEMREKVRKEEIEKLNKKREENRKIMNSIKNFKASKSNLQKKKPLFLKFEENFKWKFEVPELERRKMELREKRKYFKPIDRQELREHEEWYEGIKNGNLKKILEEPISGGLGNANNFWRMKILEEEKKVKEDKRRKDEEKIKMLVDKIKYSELIRELHAPTTNEKNKKRKKSSESKKIRSGKIFNIQESDDDKPSFCSNYWKPHKFALNSMLPQQKPARIPKRIYYLEEKRSHSKSTLKYFPSPDIATKPLANIKRITKNLEDLARKKQMISETKPFSTVSIQRSVSADNLLLKSIKAKLDLINKNS